MASEKWSIAAIVEADISGGKSEGSGILEIAPAADGSAYKEYLLTEKERGLFDVALRQWGEDWFFDSGETHVVLVDCKHESPVRKLELRPPTDASSDPTT